VTDGLTANHSGRLGSGVRAAVRRVAKRSYRTLGAVGQRLLADDPLPAPASAPHPDPLTPPWMPFPEPGAGPSLCNICRWEGDAFGGPQHVEFSTCPACGSNGRDRFLHWCLRERIGIHAALRVIECSPRLGQAYRDAMATWFFYRTSDYDLRAHAGNLRLDLQAIDLPDACIDVMLCAHVLEHVPDTDKALAELHRVIAPGGHLLLQVPVLQGHTAPPTEPEFHGDNTPVFWRFGFDLTARLRGLGFVTELLCTAELADAVVAAQSPWHQWSGEFDVPDILAGAIIEDLVVVADRTTSARLGIDPGYMYLTWDCVVV
jgi:Methyltransferase domain